MGRVPINQLLIATLSPGPALGQARTVPPPAPDSSPGDTGTQPWGLRHAAEGGQICASSPSPTRGRSIPPSKHLPRELPPETPQPLPSGRSEEHSPHAGASRPHPPPRPRGHLPPRPRLWEAADGLPQGAPIPTAEAKVGPRAHLGRLLLKLLDGPLVDAPTFVDEVAGGGGLARVHVADDHNVDVGLLLAHRARAVGRGWHDLGLSGLGQGGC